MNLVRSSSRNNHITGRSVHSQRIERLWRDVQTEVGETFCKLFHDMEDRGILDPSNDCHLCALQLVFVPEVNRQLQNFREAWNKHRIRTESRRTPEQLWMLGMLGDTDGHTSVREMQKPDSLQDLEAKLSQNQ
ncbi:hypothetical protein KP79_PYT23043 [Mizuhopecten yessoensis]|uniref:Integrase core domain-containing protein n=1 Tax=Mizuhopecten yessoensis TaxID=6573 RepID=A0A210PH79_MIZYE|nr:hypothetical protein KP79_PYT23043 [Mizuhopecten yessoensis]